MSAPTGIVPGVRRIAVLKAGGLGDVLFGLPALEALRAAYPEAWITLLTSPLGAELLGGRPGPADEVSAVPPFEGDAAAGDREALDRLCAGMAARRIDLGVQLHGGGRNSNPLLLRFGARVTAGLRTPDAAPLDREIPYVYFQPEVLRCLEVAYLVGARPVALEPRITPTVADLDAAHRLLPPGEAPLAVVHPGAGDPRRRWPVHAFAEVAADLARRGARVAVVGTHDGASAVDELGRVAADVHDLRGRTDIAELTGILSRAAVFVGNDSGPLHLAAAVGAATVGVYWCGNLVNAGPATVRRHRTVASWRLACPVCGADCMGSGCSHDASFVADVPASDVSREAVDLLSRHVRERSAAAGGGARRGL